MLTHFQRTMVAAQVYAGGCVSERQAVEIAKKLEELAGEEYDRLEAERLREFDKALEAL